MSAPTLTAEVGGLVLFLALVITIAAVHRVVRRRRLRQRWAATGRRLAAQTRNAAPSAGYEPPPRRHNAGLYRGAHERASRRRAS